MPVFAFTEGPQVAVFRHSGDEIHPWPPDGGFRPLLAIRVREANVCFSALPVTAVFVEGTSSAWEAEVLQLKNTR